MGVGADQAKAAGLDGVLASVVESVQADSGTVHFLGEDGLLHLAAGLSRRRPCRVRTRIVGEPYAPALVLRLPLSA
jgi:hypothetical protein